MVVGVGATGGLGVPEVVGVGAPGVSDAVVVTGGCSQGNGLTSVVVGLVSVVSVVVGSGVSVGLVVVAVGSGE